MPFSLGVPELIIILFIILLVFGAGRIASIGRDLGRGIREFREGLALDKGDQPNEKVKNGSA